MSRLPDQTREVIARAQLLAAEIDRLVNELRGEIETLGQDEGGRDER